MLEKKVSISKIEILEDGQMQIQEATRVFEDGVELSKTYRRWVVAPGDDVTAQDIRVKDIARVVHTPEVNNKYRVEREKNKIR